MVREGNNAGKHNVLISDNDGDASFPYRIAERYHCKGFLGSGGSGLVFKAWDDMLQRMVAIKFIRNPSFVARQRLVAEARALAKVNHPSICSIYDIGEPVDEHSSLFMVMELIEGPRLAELAGKLTTTQAIKLIHKLAEGVSELHAVGLVHNDINPGNVIITQQGNEEPMPTLIDLSIAGRPSKQSRPKGFGVTPLFCAPEQREDNEIAADMLEKVDIYSLGALLLFLVSGQPPSKNPAAQLKTIRRRCAPPLRKFILRCLAESPKKRFSSMAEVVGILGELSYYKPNRQPAILAASAGVIVALSVLVTTQLTPSAWSDDEDSEGLVNQASMHALYATQLMHEGKGREARQQAQKSIHHYRQAISLSNGQTIEPLLRLVDFVVTQQQLFSQSELSALLLDTLSLAENINSEQPQLAFAMAKIYYHLAKLHQPRTNVYQRWLEHAKTAIERALSIQPDTPHYRTLECKIDALQNQSSGGTC